MDHLTGIPLLGNVVGGLSGPAIHAIGLRLIFELAKLTDKPLIGVGGVLELADALDYFSVGATAVQLGTGVFVESTNIFAHLTKNLRDYCIDHKISSLSTIIGRTHRWLETRKK